MKIRVGPDGLYFFDRQTGLNILIDEITTSSIFWANAPRQVSIALTNACDLKCPYCYAPKYSATLNPSDVVGWLSELDINGCVGIGFGGGEPTLYPNFAELCKNIKQNTNLAVTFTTHSHHLNEKFLSKLEGSISFVRVSMDGVGPTYERLRGRAFRAFLSNLKLVKQLAPFGINFVVNASTVSDLDEAVVLASEAGAIEFLLLPEQPNRGTSGIDERTTQTLQHWVNKYKGSIPLRVSEIGAEGLPTCDPFVKETGLRAYAHIDALGNIKKSSFDNIGVPIKREGVMSALEMLRSL
jgi:MoaA/NifB/PqqE/SkfB family radical SAM enzyme